MFIFKKISTFLLMTLIFLGSFFFSGFSSNINTSSHTQGTSMTQMSFQFSPTFAEVKAWENEGGNEKETSMLNTIISGANALAGLAMVMISPLIMLASWMLSPDWTTGEVIGLRTQLYNMWIIVSNITYFVYAVLLIIIALGTIFNQKNYHYKTLLPRLALGIILVPFTWGFVQTIISLATNVTASVLTIPMETVSQMKTDKWWFEEKIIPKHVRSEFFNKTSIEEILNECKQNQSNCTSPQEVLRKSSGIYGNMLIYAYGVFEIQKIKQLNSVSDIADVAVDLLINTIMFIIFGLLTVALLSMLVVRMFWLWLYTIFSPLFTFQFVMKNNNNKWGGIFENFSIGTFISTAFVPAIVGLVLSLGLVVIGSIRSVTESPEGLQKPCNPPSWVKIENCKAILTLGGNPENQIMRGTTGEGTNKKSVTVISFGGMYYEYLSNLPANSGQGGDNNSDSSQNKSGIFGSMVVQFIALIFVWIAFMSAANASKVLQVAIKPFRDITDSAKQIPWALAGMTPIPWFGNITGVRRAIENTHSMINEIRNKQANNSTIVKALQTKEQKANESIEKAINNIKKSDMSIPQVAQEAKTAINLNITNKSDPSDDDKNRIQNILTTIAEKYKDNKSNYEQVLKEMGIFTTDFRNALTKINLQPKEGQTSVREQISEIIVNNRTNMFEKK